MQKKEPTQTATTHGDNSPATNILYTERNVINSIVGIFIVLLLTLAVIYYLFISFYTDRQRSFDKIYNDVFVRKGSYKQARIDIDPVLKNIPLPDYQLKQIRNQWHIRGIFRKMKAAYSPLSECLTDGTCDPGWYAWCMCYYAERDWRDLKSITKDIIRAGYTYSTDGMPTGDIKEIELSNLYVLDHVLERACNKKDFRK